ncbi:MAG: host attachment family protein [Paracoccaceae bacterium]
MTPLREGAWVLIADGEKALFLRNQTDGGDPSLEVVREEGHENPPTREQAANRPGRVQQSHGDGSSSYGDTDWHEFEKGRFAKDLSEILYRKAHANEFPQLVIIASSHVLGVLRDEMHQTVTDKIVAEIPKVLTNHPVHEIEHQVKAALRG